MLSNFIISITGETALWTLESQNGTISVTATKRKTLIRRRLPDLDYAAS